MYPVYVRGTAYLAAHQGNEAAAEFQKILDHRGLLWNEPTGALAHLQIGRAYAMQGDTRQSQGGVSGFSRAVERCRPEYPDPDRSQIRIREASINFWIEIVTPASCWERMPPLGNAGNAYTRLASSQDANPDLFALVGVSARADNCLAVGPRSQELAAFRFPCLRRLANHSFICCLQLKNCRSVCVEEKHGAMGI